MLKLQCCTLFIYSTNISGTPVMCKAPSEQEDTALSASTRRLHCLESEKHLPLPNTTLSLTHNSLPTFSTFHTYSLMLLFSFRIEHMVDWLKSNASKDEPRLTLFCFQQASSFPLLSQVYYEFLRPMLLITFVLLVYHSFLLNQ